MTWRSSLNVVVVALLLIGLLCGVAQAQPGKRVALLIGNQSYSGEPGNENGEWPRLSNPINDVTELARALERFGFKATVLKDLNKLQMLQAIEDFGRQSRGADATVVYYAGHGAERDLVNYLIPRDAGPLDARGTSIEANGVRLAKILEALAGNGATNIVFIDACRKLPEVKRPGERGLGPSGAVGMAPQQAPPGTIISFAARPGTAAFDGYGMRNGFYAQGLLKAFAGTDLSLIGVLAEAGRVVQALSNGHQVPESYGSDHLRVSFRFANSTQPAHARAQPPAASTSTALPRTERECVKGVCFDMVVVPGGSFKMGSADGDPDERHVHDRTIRSFAMGKTEVTQELWQAVMGSNPSHFKDCGGDCPVERVSWKDAQQFVRQLSQLTGKGYRLPSEAEWEYACRAGGPHRYCGSDDINAVAWWRGNSDIKTNPVAGQKPNAWGLYDMSGNVSELTDDCWAFNYNSTPADGSAQRSGICAWRMRRGGGLADRPTDARSAKRGVVAFDGHSIDLGVRVARTLP